MKKTLKFGDLAVCHNKKYYFPMDITRTENNTLKTNVVYFERGKYIQDTETISEDLKNKLQKFL